MIESTIRGIEYLDRQAVLWQLGNRWYKEQDLLDVFDKAQSLLDNENNTFINIQNDHSVYDWSEWIHKNYNANKLLENTHTIGNSIKYILKKDILPSQEKISQANIQSMQTIKDLIIRLRDIYRYEREELDQNQQQHIDLLKDKIRKFDHIIKAYTQYIREYSNTLIQVLQQKEIVSPYYEEIFCLQNS